jgi:hypothetical protein
MEDFLGTSIQFAEAEIKRLEREHEAEQEKIVREIIESGFLDSDFDETDEFDTDESVEWEEKELQHCKQLTDVSTSSCSALRALSESSSSSLSTLCSSEEKESDAVDASVKNGGTNDQNINNAVDDVHTENVPQLSDISAVVISDDDDHENDADDENDGDNVGANDGSLRALSYHDDDEERLNSEDEDDIVRSDRSTRSFDHVFGEIKYVVLCFLVFALAHLAHYDDAPHAVNIAPENGGDFSDECNVFHGAHSLFDRYEVHILHHFHRSVQGQQDETEDDANDQEVSIDVTSILRSMSDQTQLIHEIELSIKPSDLSLDGASTGCNQPQVIIAPIPRWSHLLRIVPLHMNMRKETMIDPVGSHFEQRVLSIGTLLSLVGFTFMMSSFAGLDEAIFDAVAAH